MTSRKRGERSVRLLKVGESLRHRLAEILLRDPPRHEALADARVTVTEVRVSPDLRHAKVFVGTFNLPDQAAAVAALNENARYLRGVLGKSIHLKFTPELTFVLDPSFDEATHIETLLEQPRVKRDLVAAVAPVTRDEEE